MSPMVGEVSYGAERSAEPHLHRLFLDGEPEDSSLYSYGFRWDEKYPSFRELPRASRVGNRLRTEYPTVIHDVHPNPKGV